MKLLFIDNFRTLAIIFIVMSHTLSFFDWSKTPQLEIVMNIIIINSTTLFVFVSGYLFQFLLPKYKYKRYIIGKLKYVALPYLIASIPAILYFTMIAEREGVPDDFYSSPKAYQIIYFYATGLHLAPYWYIPAVLIFFAFAPVFKLISTRSNLLLLSFPIFFIISLTVARDGVIYSAIHFISIYIAGMIASLYSDRVDEMSNKPSVIIATACIFFALVAVQYLTNENSYQLFYLQKLTLCITFLLLMRKSMSEKLFYIDLSATSFGIFFLHSYIITACKILIEKAISIKIEGGVIEMVVFTAFIIILCHIIVKVIKYIFKTKSRYLIGS